MRMPLIANDDTVSESGRGAPDGKRPYRPPALRDLGTLKEHVARWPISGRHRQQRYDPMETPGAGTDD
jgi:hypothetical protein